MDSHDKSFIFDREPLVPEGGPPKFFGAPDGSVRVDKNMLSAEVKTGPRTLPLWVCENGTPVLYNVIIK